ncbi:MAG TPA: SusC/RagA family TonB-linked outer membrane protein, partial [Parafilimonas sp.]|nr:SusC/RagA family TonB-linked outer membrane protein [Parafilimonas sp.]
MSVNRRANHFHAFLTGISLLVLTFNSFSQYNIQGKITNENGAPLPFASVTEKGGSSGTTTKEDGSFTIDVTSTRATLIVSYVGYETKEVSVNNQLFVSVALLAAGNSLDSVAVIGYGTARKKDLTGAVSSVSEKNFNKGIYTSPDLLIQGKVAGVQVMSNDGSPGGATTIKIRGNSAITGTGQPLFVVDGVPLDGRSLERDVNPLNFLNPIDIASIDILKDASATAIYGSRAAYGVVIINTKKGQTGEAKIDVAVSAGVSSALKTIDVLNASQYREAIKYYGVDNSFDKGGNADAQDAILQNGWQQNYSVAGSGGNDNGRYRFSAGYLNQDGIIINTGFKKYTSDFSANLKCLKSKKLGLDFHVNSSQYIQHGSDLSGGNGGSVFFALTWNPTASLTNADGSLRMLPSEGANPIAYSQYAKENLKVTTILGSISPSYKFTNWLEYKVLLSINYSSGISRSSTDQALGVYQFASPTGYASIANNELITEQITHTLNFNKDIFPNLNLNAVAGYEYMKFTSQGFNLSANGAGNGFGNYGIDYTNYIQYSDQGSRNIASYLDPISELESFFGRMIFNYKD